jgi:hypothetical protein
MGRHKTRLPALQGSYEMPLHSRGKVGVDAFSKTLLAVLAKDPLSRIGNNEQIIG